MTNVLKNKFFVLALLCSIIPTMGLTAEPECQQQNTSLICDYYAPPLKKIDSITATLLQTGENIPVAWQDYLEKSDKSTLIMMLVDSSNPARQATVAHNIADIRLILERAKDHHQFGLATLDSDLGVLVSAGSSAEDVLASLDGIQADGQSTEFYRVALEAVRHMQNSQAQRKYLFFFSDGRAEDTEYSREDVVSEAQNSAIRIIGLGYPLRANETPYTQSLRKLAEETEGAFLSSRPRENIQGLGELFDNLEQGGTFEVGLSDVYGTQTLLVTANFLDGSQTEHRISLDLPTRPVEAEQPPPTWDQEIKLWVDQNPDETMVIIAGSAIGLLLLLIIFFRLFLKRKERRLHEAAKARQQEAEQRKQEAIQKQELEELEEQQKKEQDISQPIAFLRMMDAESTVIPINKLPVTIGRSDECDIQFINDSVSRRHASLAINREGDFIITDLQSLNHTFVNGTQIEMVQLQMNDEVDVGEVRFNFIIATQDDDSDEEETED